MNHGDVGNLSRLLCFKAWRNAGMWIDLDRFWFDQWRWWWGGVADEEVVGEAVNPNRDLCIGVAERAEERSGRIALQFADVLPGEPTGSIASDIPFCFESISYGASSSGIAEIAEDVDDLIAVWVGIFSD